MDILIKHLAVIVAAVSYAAGPSMVQLTFLVLPLVAATEAQKRSKIMLTMNFYFMVLLPLIPLAYDYAHSVGYSLLVFITVWMLNTTVMATALCMRHRWRPVAVIVGVVTLSIPPLAQLSLVSPTPLAGVLFPGWGWAGIVALLVLIGVSSLGRRTVCIVSVIALLSVGSLTANTNREARIEGLDTWRGSPTETDAALFLHVHRHDELQRANASMLDSVVFPESTFGEWTPDTGSILRHSVKTIYGGARAYIDDKRYVNVVVDGKTGDIVYAQQYPIALQPVYREQAVSGRGWLQNRRFSALICIEITHPWHAAQVFSRATDQVVWIANLGWSRREWINRRVSSTAHQWAQLFGVAVVSAVNHHDRYRARDELPHARR